MIFRSFSNKPLMVFYGILFAAIWSLSFIATGISLSSIQPIWLAGIRLTLAGIILILFFAKSIYGISKNPPALFAIIVICGFLSQGVYIGASYLALVHFPTSIVNIIVSSLPLVTIPFAYILLKESLRITDITSFLLCIFGVYITLDGNYGTSTLSFSEYVFAVSILLISVLSLALGNVLIKPVISHKVFLPICGIQCFTSGIGLMIIASVIESTPTLQSLVKIKEPLLFLILCGSIVGTVLWFNVLSTFSATGASAFFLLTPIFGIFGGNFIFGEVISTSKIIGAMIILFAISFRIGAIYFTTNKHSD